MKLPLREHQFAPPRKWRFDFCWPDYLVAVEVEGGTWSGGRHVTGSGFAKDIEKYNAAAVRGWCVLRFVRSQIEDGSALALIEEVLAAGGRLMPALQGAEARC